MSLITFSTSSLLASQSTKAQQPEAFIQSKGAYDLASNGQSKTSRSFRLMGAYLPQERISYGARRARLVRRGYA